MIHVQFNGERVSLENACTVTDLLAHKNCLGNYFAVSINRHFLSRNHYASAFLNEGDVVELIFPMQGG